MERLARLIRPVPAFSLRAIRVRRPVDDDGLTVRPVPSSLADRHGCDGSVDVTLICPSRSSRPCSLL